MTKTLTARADTLADTITAHVADTLAALAADTVELVPGADVLAAAFHACTLTGDASAAASATLADITRARYAFHARRDGFTVTRNGIAVVPANKHKELSMLLWMDATGSLIAPTGKDRKGADTSFGQYLSRYGKVAQNLDYGLPALASVASASAATKAIAASAKLAKANEDTVKLGIQEIEDGRVYGEWLSTLPATLQESFHHVASALRGTGAPHVAAFVQSLAISNEESF